MAARVVDTSRDQGTKAREIFDKMAGCLGKMETRLNQLSGKVDQLSGKMELQDETMRQNCATKGMGIGSYFGTYFLLFRKKPA